MTIYNTDNSSAANYIPSTNIGKFDASYNDSNGKYTITINFKTSYVDGTEKWKNQKEKDDFRDEFFRLAKSTWEGKFQFKGTSGAHKDKIAVPEFILGAVNNNEDFELNVKAGPGGSALIGGIKLQLHGTDNSTYEEIKPAASHGNSLSSSEPRILMEYATHQEPILQAVGDLTLTRPSGTSNTWTLDVASSGKLNTFAAATANFKAVEPRFPLIITIGTGLSSKFQNVSNAIQTYLNGQNCTYPIQFIHNNTGKFGKTKGKTTITVSSGYKTQPNDFLDYWKNSGWLHTYCVSPHEFGHCIGLPDEYTTYDSMARIRNAHQDWENLCLNAGVSHNPYVKLNYSIMSNGVLFAPCHAVTLWERLEAITPGTSHWAIEMVDAANTKAF